MNQRRFQFLFTIAFVVTGVAIGLVWALRELKHPTRDVEQAYAEEEPFQTVDEALAEASEGDAGHIRQMLYADEPMPLSPVPAAPVAVVSSQALAPAQAPATQPGAVESASVVYDASAELENTKRLIDSYAPLRDPAVSLDSPENRKAIQQMQANAAKRAAEAPKSLPSPQR